MALTRYLRLKDKSQRVLSPKEITLDEIKGASMAIVRMVQRQHFQDEILALESGKKNKPESRLITLSPILCDVVICVGGRLRHAPLTPENIHPMIVPHQHHIATLIIRFFPVLGHAGREHVLSVIRQYYWIINARVLARQILRR